MNKGNNPSLLTIIAVCVGSIGAVSEEKEPTPVSPEVRSPWVQKGAIGSSQRTLGKYSWVSFENSDHENEILAFFTFPVGPRITVRAGAIGEGSINSFRSYGEPSWATTDQGTSIDQYVSYRYVDLALQGPENNDIDVEPIEYTYFYEPSDDSATTMAHGYCVIAGERVLYAQHTSPRPITSLLLYDHVVNWLQECVGLTIGSYMAPKVLENFR